MSAVDHGQHYILQQFVTVALVWDQSLFPTCMNEAQIPLTCSPAILSSLLVSDHCQCEAYHYTWRFSDLAVKASLFTVTSSDNNYNYCSLAA